MWSGGHGKIRKDTHLAWVEGSFEVYVTSEEGILHSPHPHLDMAKEKPAKAELFLKVQEVGLEKDGWSGSSQGAIKESDPSSVVETPLPVYQRDFRTATGQGLQRLMFFKYWHHKPHQAFLSKTAENICFSPLCISAMISSHLSLSKIQVYEHSTIL
jgi:hypothetical protein